MLPRKVFTPMALGLISVILLLSGAAGCSTSMAPVPVSNMPSAVRGIWASNGYGY